MDSDEAEKLKEVRRIFSGSRKLSRHLGDVKELEKTGGKTIATRLYGPVFPPKPKSGRPTSEAVEVGLELLAQYNNREES